MCADVRSNLTRRQLLLGGTAAAATTAMSGRIGRLVERAYAAEPTKHAPLSDIEHFVFLMMENRSLDHYFGVYPGVRGFGDRHALPGVFRQRGFTPGKGPDPHGHLPPFHLDTKNLTAYAECVEDISHEWTAQHQVWNHGKMNKWVATHLATDGDSIGPVTMGYYERKDIPLYHALADAFTLCDRYFCSVLGPTDPNRLMWFSASIDPAGEHGGPVLTTLTANRAQQYGALNWRTMPENLSEAGVSWKVYQDASSETLLNPLLYFKNYTDNTTYLGKNADGGFSYPAEFQADVSAGTLPAVSWVFPFFAACDHPAAPPVLGERFVAGVLETLVNKPSVWEKTALIVMYDENGGFFDHVPPPVAPAGTEGEYLTMDTLPTAAGGVRGPIGLGFRVPCLVLSPYSRGGFISSAVFDHTSQLKLLEKRFGVDVPNLTKWRRRTVGDMTAAFSFGRRPRDGVPAFSEVPSKADAITLVEEDCPTNGLLGTVDRGTPTPVPSHVPPPKQKPGKPRRPVH
jgi:phospholipase C